MQTWRISRVRNQLLSQPVSAKQTSETEKKWFIIHYYSNYRTDASSQLPVLFWTVYVFLLFCIILYSFPSFLALRLPSSDASLKIKQIGTAAIQSFLRKKDWQRHCHMLSAWAWRWTIPTRMSYSVLLQDAAAWRDSSLGSEPAPQPENWTRHRRACSNHSLWPRSLGHLVYWIPSGSKGKDSMWNTRRLNCCHSTGVETSIVFLRQQESWN